MGRPIRRAKAKEEMRRALRALVQTLADGAMLFAGFDVSPWLVPCGVVHRDLSCEQMLREVGAAPIAASTLVIGTASVAPQRLSHEAMAAKLGPAFASIAGIFSSALVAPLQLRRGRVGVVVALRDRGGAAFTTQDEILLTSLAMTVARVADRVLSPAGDSLDEGLDGAHAIDALASALSSATTREQIASVTVDVVARTFDAALVEITVPLARTSTLLGAPSASRESTGSVGPMIVLATHHPHPRGAPSCETSSAAAVLGSGDAIFDARAASWKRWYLREAALVEGEGALACVPLFTGDHCEGALTVVAREDGEFDRESRALLRSIAKHVALALGRETLEAAERTAQQHWILLAETSKAVATLDTASIASGVTRTLVPALGDACALDLVVDGVVTRAYAYGEELPALSLDPTRTPHLVRAILSGREGALGALVVARAGHRPAFTAREFAVVDDIADRCALAVENARLYDESRRAVSARDEFLAIAGHELRTPLSTLNMYVWGLIAQQGAAPAGKQEDLALRQITRLDRLVDQLLDVSRVTMGRLVIEREPVHLAELVERVVADLALVDDDRSVTVEVDPSIVGEWDRGRLEQVLINLLSNAVRYGEGSPISIRAHRDPEGVRIVVRDRGPGMDATARARVFEREARLVPKRPQEGLGIGLWITRQLVEAHGGTIVLTSRVGDGVEVVITLPLRGEDVASRAVH